MFYKRELKPKDSGAYLMHLFWLEWGGQLAAFRRYVWYKNTFEDPRNQLNCQHLLCQRCISSSYFHDVIMIIKPGISYTKSKFFLCGKEAWVRKCIVIFKEFWTCFFIVSIKITFYYFFMLKNRNKRAKSTQKSCYFAFLWVEIWKFSKLILSFDSIFEELSYAIFKLEKIPVTARDIPKKNWKKKLQMIYLGNYGMDHFQILVSLNLKKSSTFIADNIFSYLW